MARATLNLEIQRFVTFGPIQIVCKNASGVVVPLAGYQAFAEVRKDEKSSRILDLAPVIAADDADGLITIPEIPWQLTDDLSPVIAQWDLILEDPNGKRLPPIVGGRININTPISQP
jgi:hypothetical protein